MRAVIEEEFGGLDTVIRAGVTQCFVKDLLFTVDMYPDRPALMSAIEHAVFARFRGQVPVLIEERAQQFHVTQPG